MQDWSSVLTAVTDVIGTSRDKRAIITSIVPDMIADNLNQTQARNLFKEHGMGIRQSDFNDIYNSFAQDNNLFNDLISMTDNDVFPEEHMKRSTRLNDKKYRFVFNYSYRDDENKAFFLGNVSFATDENPTLEALKNLADAYLKEHYKDVHDNLYNTQFARAYYNEPL